jgi:two-component system nitrogen regulation sensor histidine kinase NtrY
MGSRSGASGSDGGFALGVLWRAVLAGVLAFAIAWALSRQYWATAVVLALGISLVALDLVRAAGSADRLLARFVDGLAAEGFDRPAPAPGLGRLAQAVDQALERLGLARAERQRRIDRLEALTDTLAAALLVVDEAGAVVQANRAAHALLGEATGPLTALPGLAPGAAAALLALPPGGRAIVRLADRRALLAQTSSFQDPAGGRRRLIALQSVSGDLAAVEIKAWQDLVRVLAHEMMNSLTPVCSLAESLEGRLRGTGAAADLTEAAEVIARRSTGLMSFVDRYRQLADLPPAARVPVRLAEVFARLDRLMGPLMAQGAVDYASRIEPAGLTVQADPDLLDQALINLLKNALEAVRGRDGARVRLVAVVQDDSAVLAVEDNGPGLDGEDPEAAFVPFYSTKAGGSGVGLTLSRQIALAHGGRLDHQPAQPSGAVFRLTLPL